MENTWLEYLTLSKRRDLLRSKICEAGERLDKYSWITHLGTAIVGMLMKNIPSGTFEGPHTFITFKLDQVVYFLQRHHVFKCLVVIYNLKITLSISPFYSCLSPKSMLLTKDSQSWKKQQQQKPHIWCKDACCENIKEEFESFPVLRLHKQMVVQVWWTFLPDIFNL